MIWWPNKLKANLFIIKVFLYELCSYTFHSLHELNAKILFTVQFNHGSSAKKHLLLTTAILCMKTDNKPDISNPSIHTALHITFPAHTT